jgi:hypothetical protein
MKKSKMTIQEAVKAMRKGHKVTRPGEAHCVYLNDDLVFCAFEYSSPGYIIKYRFNPSELEANDWSIVKGE